MRLPDGRVLAWSAYGDPDGFPVFYLHGALSSRLEAAVLDQAAHEQGIRLIGVDRPGLHLAANDLLQIRRLHLGDDGWLHV